MGLLQQKNNKKKTVIHQKRVSEIERTKQNAEEDQQFKTSQIPSKQVKT